MSGLRKRQNISQATPQEYGISTATSTGRVTRSQAREENYGVVPISDDIWNPSQSQPVKEPMTTREKEAYDAEMAERQKQLEEASKENLFYGPRTTTEGKQKFDFVAGRFLQFLNGGNDDYSAVINDSFFGETFSDYDELYSFVNKENKLLKRKFRLGPNEIPYEITYPDDEDPNDIQKYNVTKNLEAANEGCQINSEIEKNFDEDQTSVLVFLITSPKHAIIGFYTESKVYTIGYGFNASVKTNQPIAHMVEKIPGVAYTSDYLVPSEQQQCKISWIGFLNEGILNRLKDFLKTVKEIEFNLEKEDGEYVVTNKCYLLFSKAMYIEAASVMPGSEYFDFYNCLTWAQHILGVNNLNCGAEGNPKWCTGINETEGAELMSILRIRDPVSYKTRLTEFITRMQGKNNIIRTNICTRIGRSLGLCGGKKTKKRNYKKNKKINRKTKNTNKTNKTKKINKK